MDDRRPARPLRPVPGNPCADRRASSLGIRGKGAADEGKPHACTIAMLLFLFDAHHGEDDLRITTIRRRENVRACRLAATGGRARRGRPRRAPVSLADQINTASTPIA